MASQHTSLAEIRNANKAANNTSNTFDYKRELDLRLNFLEKDVALKALLFSMVFYIVNSKLMNKLLSCLDKYTWLERNLVQAVIFGIIFYIVSVNL